MPIDLVLWIYSLPTWVAGFLIIGVMVAISSMLVIAAQRFLPNRIRQNAELIAMFSQSSGVLYSVLLAMITVNAWQNFSEIEETISNEAYTVGDAYRDAGGYPEPLRAELRATLRGYVDSVVDKEWTELAHGIEPMEARLAVDRLFALVTHFEPKTQAELVVHQEFFRAINHIGHLRRERISGLNQAVLPILWVVVWIGAVINLGITAASGSGRPLVDHLLNGSFAVNIGLVTFLILALDHPFLGEIRVDQTPFFEVIGLMEHVDQLSPEP